MLLIACFVAIFIFLQIPYGQTKATKYATEWLSKKVKYPIHIEFVYLNWVDEIVLKNVQIKDIKGYKMIELESLKLNFRLTSLLGKNIIVDELTLKKPHVYLKYNPAVEDINMGDFIYSLTHMDKKPSKPTIGKHSEFIIAQISIEDGYCSFDHPEKAEDTSRFDPQHFKIDSIQLKANYFNLTADTITLHIVNMGAKDLGSHLRIKNFQTQFQICENYLHLDSLDAQIGDSRIRKEVHLTYNGYRQLGQIEDSVKFNAIFDDTYVTAKDIKVFAPELGKIEDDWHFSTYFNGRVNNFILKDLDLSFGKKTKIKGKAGFKGLPNWDNTLISLDFNQSDFLIEDIRQYLPEASHKILNKVHEGKFKGNFYGFHNDFVANGQFDTDLGLLSTDINLKLVKDKPAIYSGQLQTQQLEIGKLTGQESFVGKMDMNGSIEGIGFNLQEASFAIKAKISSLEVNHYAYKNIHADLHLSHEEIKGSVDIKDSNLVVDAIGELDLRKNNSLYHFDVNIHKLRAEALGFSKEPLHLRTEIRSNFTGEGIEKLNGNITFQGTHIDFQKRALDVNYFQINSRHENGTDKLNLQSEFADAEFVGSFNVPHVLHDLKALFQSTLSHFKFFDSTATFSKKDSIVFPHFFTYSLLLRDINPLLYLYAPEWQLNKNVRINGVYDATNGQKFGIETDIDYVQYKNYMFWKNKLDFQINRKGNSINSQFNVNSDRQKKADTVLAEDFSLKSSWVNKDIQYTIHAKQFETSNEATLSGNLIVENEKISLHMLPSKLILLEKEWNFKPGFEMVFKRNSISFEKIVLSNQVQSFSISGKLSKNINDKATLHISDFDLQNLNQFIDRDLKGNINGYVTLSNFFDPEFYLASELTFSNISMDNVLIGNFSGYSKWNNKKKNIDVAYALEREGAKVLDIKGEYNPSAQEQLDLVFSFNNTSLSLLEPFLKGILSNINGYAKGEVNVKGSLNKPQMNGVLKLQNCQLTIDYLQSTLYFSDDLLVKPSSFSLNNVSIRDAEKGTGTIDFKISHEHFKNLNMSINAEMKYFKIMDTEQNENEVYYGTAFASGEATITSDFKVFNIDARARTERGTRIYIPLGSRGKIGPNDYIRFKQKEELETKLKYINPKSSSFNMNFNFHVTNDAYVEILLDPISGDGIKGYGNGNIRLDVDSKGGFSMYGNYKFNQGTYNFSFMDLIHKEFNIRKGSSITWSGSPYYATIDMSASYDVLASLKPLISDLSQEESVSKPQLSRAYPVSTNIILKGDLLKPQISYDIIIKDYPQNLQVGSGSLYTYVSAFQNRIQSDDQFLGRQVLGLLVFRRFLTDNQAGISAGQTLASNLSEMVSTNINRWLSDEIDKNLQVDVNLNGLDKESLSSSQLRLSYSLFDGKIRITRNSALSSSSQSQSSTGAIIGEWTIEYILTPDGRFRLKGFNKNNPNILATGTSTGFNMVAGASIMHTASFNNLGELLSSKRKKRKRNVKKP